MMKDKKGEFTTQGMIISVLVVGLFMGVMGAIITMMSGYYDTTGYNASTINSYDKVQNLSGDLESVSSTVSGVTVEKNWFDFFSGIWSKLWAPFKFIIKTFRHIITIFQQASSTFKLLPEFAGFFSAVILTLVVVGILIIKFGLGRNK